MIPPTQSCNVVQVDDRSRVTADAADSYEGRHSARILMPTSLPLVIPVPMLSDPESPLLPGDRVSCTLQARSSPPGVKIGWHSSALDPQVVTPLLRPLPGGVATGADWTQVTRSLVISNSSGTAPGTLGAFANKELVQLQLVSPFETAAQVWIDAVSVRRA